MKNSFKPVWVEINDLGEPIRIFKNQKAAINSGLSLEKISEISERHIAVSFIRNRIWERTNGDCEWCGFPITEQSLHMHEVKSRGEGGEISLENSVGLCANCHITGPDAAHSNRRPKFKGIPDV